MLLSDLITVLQNEKFKLGVFTGFSLSFIE